MVVAELGTETRERRRRRRREVRGGRPRRTAAALTTTAVSWHQSAEALEPPRSSTRARVRPSPCCRNPCSSVRIANRRTVTHAFSLAFTHSVLDACEPTSLRRSKSSVKYVGKIFSIPFVVSSSSYSTTSIVVTSN